MALLPPPKGNGFLCHKNFMNEEASLTNEESFDTIEELEPEV